MMINKQKTTRGIPKNVHGIAVLLGLALAMSACADPLAVSDGDIVTPGSLTGEVGLQTVRNGALFDFVRAYQGGGQTDGQVMISGLMTDEWSHAGTFTTRAEVEQRQIPDDNGTLNGVYLRLHQARVALEGAAERIGAESLDPATDTRIGEMLMFAGFSYIAFGENYCNGVPFSQQTETELILGDPETNVQMFQRAVARFDAALAEPGISAADANAARIGKGRALLNLGDYAGAASAVAGVATDFAKATTHSNNTAVERNTIFEFNNNPPRWGVGDNEGINGLPFASAGDPRILATFDPAGAFDQSFPAFWRIDNYTNRADPMPFALGIEARLIEAENQLALGNTGPWLATLNTIRQAWGTDLADIIRPGADNSAPGTLADLVDPGSADARVDMMFDERAFWLFSTGHRLGDFRRLIRQYGRDAESVFPTGPYFKGGAYLTDIQLPIPEDELNNPQFIQCIDRAA